MHSLAQQHHLLPALPPSPPVRGVPHTALLPFATSLARRLDVRAAAVAAADSPATAFWDYNLLFSSQRAESPVPVKLRVAEGALPADFPAGTYYLAGPGLFADDHGSTVHPLDGHGYLRAFQFRPGGSTAAVQYSARYVDTEAKREEQQPEAGDTWQFTHRGPFSVLQGGRRVGNVKVMKNVANTAVLQWGGRLLCLWEGGQPYEIDPRSLDTIGTFDVIDLDDNKQTVKTGGRRTVVEGWPGLKEAEDGGGVRERERTDGERGRRWGERAGWLWRSVAGSRRPELSWVWREGRRWEEEEEKMRRKKRERERGGRKKKKEKKS